MSDAPLTPTPEEIKNGWTAEAIEDYRREREQATDLVGGLVVTPFQRPKPAPVIQSARTFNAHKW